MWQTNKPIFESEGFHAHNYLTGQRESSWAYVTDSKLTTTLIEQKTTWENVKVSHHGTSVATPKQLSFDFELKDLFQTLANWWHVETEHISNLIKASKHPAYQQIIGMGKLAPSLIIPLILRELQSRPDHWFAALHEISGQDPVGLEDGFDEAIRAWIEWGKQQRYIS